VGDDSWYVQDFLSFLLIRFNVLDGTESFSGLVEILLSRFILPIGPPSFYFSSKDLFFSWKKSESPPFRPTGPGNSSLLSREL